MESGLPMLNCMLQHTLRSLCSSESSSSANSSKWIYAVFWRILPRNYPPPKGDYGGSSVLDRSKGNKRNWILVWEDGFCDLCECEQAGSGYLKGRFGANVFFKMSHEVYNFGEGLVGKVAADNSHKWVFNDAPNQVENSNFISSWNVSTEPQPKAWEFQFNSGIQTIAIISVREGIIQLGSFDKKDEDLNLVISIQRKLSYLQSIPGVFAMQRPYLPVQHPYILKPNVAQNMVINGSNATSSSIGAGVKRLFNHTELDDQMIKNINSSWNKSQNEIGLGLRGSSSTSLADPNWSMPFPPPLLPSISSSLGALLSKLPSVSHSPHFNNAIHDAPNIMTTNATMLFNNDNDNDNINCAENKKTKFSGGIVKMGSSSCHLDVAQDEKHSFKDPNHLGLEKGQT